jgi:hypothetical protein
MRDVSHARAWGKRRAVRSGCEKSGLDAIEALLGKTGSQAEGR